MPPEPVFHFKNFTFFKSRKIYFKAPVQIFRVNPFRHPLPTSPFHWSSGKIQPLLIEIIALVEGFALQIIIGACSTMVMYSLCDKVSFSCPCPIPACITCVGQHPTMIRKYRVRLRNQFTDVWRKGPSFSYRESWTSRTGG